MKTAVVLFNLGAPDSLEAIEPFLLNLFSDPAIMTQPAVIRWPLARFIARRRAKITRGIYQQIGGASPLLAETKAQAAALGELLGDQCKVFIAMRYWHPLTAEAIEEIAAYDPDEVLLLPLYPQYSTTTTGSSLKLFKAAWDALGHRAEVRALCCYAHDTAFLGAFTDQLRRKLHAVREAQGTKPLRLLFSAHGLPQKIVDKGDPYAWQVAQMAQAVVVALGEPDLDFAVCFQSRVGPVTWLKPYINDEIRRAGADQVGLLIAPIAFVSEHSETLVELDIDFARLAESESVLFYERMPTLSADPAFIGALAGLARMLGRSQESICSAEGVRRCPDGFKGCPLQPAETRT